MKIIFMGTPDFAIPSLKKIVESNHEISAVVTAPDKERGRGQKVSYTPVKEFALEKRIDIIQPDNLKDENFIDLLKRFKPDLFVVVAFRILPPEVFKIPVKGSFNLHASLLPKFRGAAPIQWALIKGEKETGVTTFALEEKVDTGNIYLQKKMKIDDDDNLGSLHDKLSMLGADAVIETIDMIDKNNFKLVKQDDNLATPAPKIKKETGHIDWNLSAPEINNLVRGLSPFPGAYFYHDEKQIKVYKSKVDKNKKLKSGEIKSEKGNLYVGTGDGSLEILELQQEGRKRLTAEEFLRGYSFN